VTTGEIWLAVTLVALVAALFALALIEASLLHVRRSAVASRVDDSDHRAERLLDLLDDLPTVMNAVLLAVLLLQVTSTAIAGFLAQRWFGGVGITVATVAVTIVLFIYGEAIPKTIAIADPVRHAQRFSGPIRVLSTVLGPLVSVLVRIAEWQSPRTGRIDTVSAVSERELLHLTNEAAAAGEIDESDAELIGRSFTLGDLRVHDVFIPMARVVSVSPTTTVAEALKTAIRAGHRRLPVFDDAEQRIIGFVRLRDLADASMVADDQDVTGRIREAAEVESAALVIDVFREMQHTRRHLASVRRSDGTTVGIITVEDIVEELLGEIEEPDPTNQ
jgi:CBS domain containing-hemolysin-like protein